MKRLIALVVVGVMSMVLSGCGQQAPKPTEMKVEETAAPAEHGAESPAVEKSAAEPAAEPAATHE